MTDKPKQKPNAVADAVAAIPAIRERLKDWSTRAIRWILIDDDIPLLLAGLEQAVRERDVAVNQLAEKDLELGLSRLEVVRSKELLESCETVLVERDKTVTALRDQVAELEDQLDAAVDGLEAIIKAYETYRKGADSPGDSHDLAQHIGLGIAAEIAHKALARIKAGPSGDDGGDMGPHGHSCSGCVNARSRCPGIFPPIEVDRGFTGRDTDGTKRCREYGFIPVWRPDGEG